MPELVGLNDVRGGKLVCQMTGSMTGAMKHLRRHRAVTGAGTYGAWHVYRNDDGLYVCEFFRFMRQVNVAILTTKGAVRDWLRYWMPKCRTSGGERP